MARTGMQLPQYRAVVPAVAGRMTVRTGMSNVFISLQVSRWKRIPS